MPIRLICRVCAAAVVAVAGGCAAPNEAVQPSDALPPAPLFGPAPQAASALDGAPLLDSRLLPEDDLSRRGYVVRGQESSDARRTRRASPAAK